ncbi:MAG: response regulator transcription factor [Desulfobacterales bacterium]|nr:MAG: response regulator transcription factor [Desulfobacterales bacterium]
MVQKKTILIVDDHGLFRDGLKAIIERNANFEVVGEAGNGREALKMVQKFKPDVALIDISLPDKSGIELTRDVLKFSPTTRIMIVSMHSKIDYIVGAFRAGATGYVIKESASDKLLQGIKTVIKGDFFMDTSVSQKIVKKLVGLQEKEIKIPDDAYDTLTPREQEIMALVAEGHSTNEIGEMLFISSKTVENHRSSIMRKLDLHSMIDIARYAAKLGLINIDLWKE